MYLTSHSLLHEQHRQNSIWIQIRLSQESGMPAGRGLETKVTRGLILPHVGADGKCVPRPILQIPEESPKCLDIMQKAT